MGGAVRAIEERYYQTEIANSALRHQQAVERKEKIVVGVNEFVTETASQPELLHISETVSRRQLERLGSIRKTRNANAVRNALAGLRGAATTNTNLIPFMLRAVEVYASVGEISDVLRAVWGEYKE